jgi:hypothetical protein
MADALSREAIGFGEEGHMKKDFWARFATGEFRWIARILGTLIGLVALMELIEALGYLDGADTRFYVIRLAFILVFSGSVVGWFKELPAALLILGGCAILLVLSVRTPGAIVMTLVPALVGLLYLFISFGTEKQ